MEQEWYLATRDTVEQQEAVAFTALNSIDIRACEAIAIAPLMKALIDKEREVERKVRGSRAASTSHVISRLRPTFTL